MERSKELHSQENLYPSEETVSKEKINHKKIAFLSAGRQAVIALVQFSVVSDVLEFRTINYLFSFSCKRIKAIAKHKQATLNFQNVPAANTAGKNP